MKKAISKTHQAVHKHLKLQNHRHTGRVLHHRHTSYGGLVLIFAVAAASMAAVTMAGRAAAGSLVSVGGVVAVPPPAAASIIGMPTNGSALSSSDTLVAGSCPPGPPQLSVAIMVDETLAGSTVCDANNNFALPVKLLAGSHRLVAQTYTITGGRAPDSEAVSVTYQPRQNSALATVTGPAVTPNEPFSVLHPDRTVAWTGTITGGSEPYSVLIDWGDGNRTTQTATAGDQQFSHQYSNGQSHTVVLAVSGSDRHSSQLYYAVASYTAFDEAAPVAAVSENALPGAGTVLGLYGLFLTVLAVSGIIWLEAKHAAKLEGAAA